MVEKERKRPDGLGELTGELVEDKERVEVPQLEPACADRISFPDQRMKPSTKNGKKKLPSPSAASPWHWWRDAALPTT